MKIRSVLSAFVVVAAVVACAAPANDPAAADTANHEDEVRNIILLIADGAGVGAWTAAKYAEEQLAVKHLPVVGLVDTRSAMHKVSDSAAGATVLATGERTMNRTISVGPASACPVPQRGADEDTDWPAGCEPLETWFEVAKQKGKATGLVTTTHVVDATPAAFVAHSPSRYYPQVLAAQFADFGLDVLLGGGERHFLADARADGRDLLGEMCGIASCVSSAEELHDWQPDDRPLIGLFASGDMDALDERPVALPAMVDAALRKLGRDADGFVAMFETEATDNATHANAPLERIVADMLEFDRAVEVSLDFARRTPGTLVVVTADHETGGLSLVEKGRDFELMYGTHGHSAAFVPLFATGPQAERFGGFRENYEIGRALMDIVRNW